MATVKSWKEEFEAISAGHVETRPTASFGALSLSGVEEKTKGLGQKIQSAIPKDLGAWAKEHSLVLIAGSLIAAALYAASRSEKVSEKVSEAFGGHTGATSGGGRQLGWRSVRDHFERHGELPPASQRVTLQP